jgi:squalene-hopene/tetraprenyl-beta-curcumene cyclase
MVRKQNRPVWFSVLVLACVSPVLAEGPSVGRDASLLMEARAAMQRGARYLAAHQQENGSWSDQVAITGLVVTALVGTGLEGFGPESEIVAAALEHIRSAAREDGGIYEDFYAGYSTSVCAMALVEAGMQQDRELIAKARAFLLRGQADEDEGLEPGDPGYGGWGYEPDPSGEGMHRPDMSNTQFALEAIRSLEQMAEEDRAEAQPGEAGVTETELAYDRAIEFLQRCQNLRATNDQPWASNDGGFVYRPGESNAGETAEGGLRSYGGMTYAGLKSMIYAKLDRADPRVRAAYQWACRHWSVTENPGLGEQGLYYYYVTMARALNVYGEERIADGAGVSHDWRVELVDQLLRVQNADGSWVNENGRWMEQMPDLVTAYALLALAHATVEW